MDKEENNSKYSTLQVKIIQGVELKIHDESYIYVVVQYGDVTKQTTRIAQTANPTWIQTLSFVVTPIRNLKINVFYNGNGREKRIGKIKQVFDITQTEEITYKQKITRGKLIYSIQVAPEALPITSQPIIPPNPDYFSDSTSSDDENINEADPASPRAGNRIFKALEPANPSGLLDSIVKAISPKVQRTQYRGGGPRAAIGNAIGDGIGQACLYMFCYIIVVAIIIVAVIITLVTRFT
jgi:hypothetical protein